MFYYPFKIVHTWKTCLPRSMLNFCLQRRPMASQLPSPFLAISHTIDVISLNIANVFQIWSALAGFIEIALGFESFSFCSVQERERVSSTPTGLVWNTNMAAVSLFWNTSMPDMTSCENAILNWREITFRILDFSSIICRWTGFPCTSKNQAGSAQRGQQNWAVVEFKEDCFGERFCDFWQSRGWKLHVFCTFRTTWPHQRN